MSRTLSDLPGEQLAIATANDVVDMLAKATLNEAMIPIGLSTLFRVHHEESIGVLRWTVRALSLFPKVDHEGPLEARPVKDS